LDDIRSKLNAVSPSFCLAKWTQVTVHLQTGLTHSCHHPVPHRIQLDEIATDPSSLHNSRYKLLQRKLMLDGERPKECSYCWRIEDSSEQNLSDRFIKSNEPWSMIDFDKVTKLPWNKKINPRYLEVSFAIDCNFRCAYCMPSVSSSILAEYHKFGHYKVLPYLNLKVLEDRGISVIPKGEPNPYVDAFWKWWPEIKNDLLVFRITGGEPLLSKDAFKMLESISTDGFENLEFAINTNFSAPELRMAHFFELSRKISVENKVKTFDVYTSVDTFGDHAEYIRFGLKFDTFISNIEKFLSTVPNVTLIFMVTFNALSAPNFHMLLKEIVRLKKGYRRENPWDTRVRVDISILTFPEFFHIRTLPKQYLGKLQKCYNYMRDTYLDEEKKIPAFYPHELQKMERILRVFETDSNDLNYDVNKLLRQLLRSFLKEYDFRKGTSFDKTFPELSLDLIEADRAQMRSSE
jgi:organic radical activating enzyme